MNNIDEKIKLIFSEEQIPPLSCDFTIRRTLDNLKIKKKFCFRNIKTCIATVCCSLFLVTGVVFAKDIETLIKNKFSILGKSIDTAIDNNYTAKSNTEDIERVFCVTDAYSNQELTTINVKSNIKNTVMDDYTIAIEMSFEFDNILNNYVNLGKDEINGNIDYENSNYFELNDLLIMDEENRILYYNYENEKIYKKYFTNSNSKFSDCPKYTSSCSATIGNINNSDNSIDLDLELLITSNNLPKSKKIFIYLNTINLIPKNLDDTENLKVILSSNQYLIFEIDLPEEMYNRSSTNSYKLVSSSNKDFDSYKAELSDTGFEIGVLISNIEKPIYPTRLDEIESSINEGFYGALTRENFVNHYGEEYVTLYENYYSNFCVINDIGVNSYAPWIYKQTDGCYIINSNNEIFKRIFNIAPDYGGFIENSKYLYGAIYDMTKYNATDNITLVLDFKGEVVTLELEKIK